MTKKEKNKWNKRLEEIGINKDLVELNEHGFFAKNVACQMLMSNEDKFKLINLNTEIQSLRK